MNIMHDVLSNRKKKFCQPYLELERDNSKILKKFSYELELTPTTTK